MTTDALELPLTHWLWVTALAGIVSNIAWELFNYFGHAMAHSLASAWHEFKKLPAHVFSLHAPLRVAGIALAALAVVSFAQTTGGIEFAAAPMRLLELYRTFARAVGDAVFAAVISENTRHLAYDMIIVALVMIFVVWRTAAGWRHYADFQDSHGGGVSFGVYFGLHLMGALGAVVLALWLLGQLR